MISMVGAYLILAALIVSATPSDTERWERESYAYLLAGVGLSMIVFF